MSSVDIIKEKIDFIEVVSKYTNLKKSGRGFVGLCPFHNEKTPSFHVDPDKKLFHCFGCGKGGDLINFIMEIENLSFGEAIEYLAKEYNIKLPEKKFKGSKIESDIYKLNKELYDAYNKLLFSETGKIAYKYLKEKRGFSDETINEFGLGYSPENIIKILKDELKKYPLTVLIRSGNFINQGNTLIPFMKNRITIPIMSVSDRVLGFGGRTLGDDTPKYKNSPDTPVYKKRSTLFGLNITKKYIREEGFAILVEGYFDLISIYQHGIRNAVASLGTSLTREQAFTLKKFTDKVVIFYDFDTAGINAIKRSIPILFEAGIYVEIFKGKKGMDPDDFIRELGVDEFRKSLSGAINPVSFYLGKNKIKDPVKKKKALEGISEILLKVDDPIFLDSYINEVSYLLEISSQYIRDTIAKKRKKTVNSSEEKINPELEIELFEKIIINYIYNNSYETLKPYFSEIKEEYFDHFKYPKIILSLMRAKERDGESFEESLNNFLSENEQRVLYFLLFDKEEIFSEHDFISAISELRSKYLTTKIKNINKALKEKAGNEEELKKLLSEKIRLGKILDKLNFEEVV